MDYSWRMKYYIATTIVSLFTTTGLYQLQNTIWRSLLEAKNMKPRRMSLPAYQPDEQIEDEMTDQEYIIKCLY